VSADLLDELLVRAIVEGNDASFEDLAKLGPCVVSAFGGWLDGRHVLQIPSGRDREFIDNTSTLSCRLARRFPDEYLARFNSARWLTDSFVLLGLGWTGRSEALPVLIQALFSEAPGVTRLSAAIALGLLPGPDSVQVLVKALDDHEYLVQYHAITSLGQIGDKDALDRLLLIAATPSSPGIAMIAPRAARNLAQRLSVEVQVPEPRLSEVATTQVEARRRVSAIARSASALQSRPSKSSIRLGDASFSLSVPYRQDEMRSTSFVIDADVESSKDRKRERQHLRRVNHDVP
jgi:hypothetical protein